MTAGKERRARAKLPVTAITDEQFIALVDENPNLDLLHVKTGMSVGVFLARARMLGVDELLYEAAPVSDYRLYSKRCSAAELAALQAAYPGQSYRNVNMSTRDIRPATNPPLLKCAA